MLNNTFNPYQQNPYSYWNQYYQQYLNSNNIQQHQQLLQQQQDSIYNQQKQQQQQQQTQDSVNNQQDDTSFASSSSDSFSLQSTNENSTPKRHYHHHHDHHQHKNSSSSNSEATTVTRKKAIDTDTKKRIKHVDKTNKDDSKIKSNPKIKKLSLRLATIDDINKTKIKKRNSIATDRDIKTRSQYKYDKTLISSESLNEKTLVNYNNILKSPVDAKNFVNKLKTPRDDEERSIKKQIPSLPLNNIDSKKSKSFQSKIDRKKEKLDAKINENFYFKMIRDKQIFDNEIDENSKKYLKEYFSGKRKFVPLSSGYSKKDKSDSISDSISSSTSSASPSKSTSTSLQTTSTPTSSSLSHKSTTENNNKSYSLKQFDKLKAKRASSIPPDYSNNKNINNDLKDNSTPTLKLNTRHHSINNKKMNKLKDNSESLLLESKNHVKEKEGVVRTKNETEPTVIKIRDESDDEKNLNRVITRVSTLSIRTKNSPTNYKPMIDIEKETM
jgi:hypothetical protein